MKLAENRSARSHAHGRRQPRSPLSDHHPATMTTTPRRPTPAGPPISPHHVITDHDPDVITRRGRQQLTGIGATPARAGCTLPIDCWRATNRGEGRVHWRSMGAKTAAACLYSHRRGVTHLGSRAYQGEGRRAGARLGHSFGDSSPLSADWAQERGESADLGSTSLPGRPRGVVPGLLVRQSPSMLRKPGAWI
jgi:hypothetical protein